MSTALQLLIALLRTTAPKFRLNVQDWLKSAAVAGIVAAIASLANDFSHANPVFAAHALAAAAWVADLARRLLLGAPADRTNNGAQPGPKP